MAIKNFARYFHLLGVFAKNSLAAQLEFRANFVSGLLVETGFFLAKLTYVFLIYKTGVVINGMRPDYILLFIGTYGIMTGIYMSIYPNFTGISTYIKDGTMDFYLVKPVSQLFLVTFRYIDFAMPLPNILGGTIMVAMAWRRCGLALDFLHIGGFLLFLALGTVLTYAIFLLPRLLSFWVISTSGVTAIADSAWDFNNMPMGIYSRVIQGIGSFLFPVFLITNVPGLVAGGKISLGFFIWALFAPFLFMAILLLAWKKALRHYSSASS